MNLTIERADLLKCLGHVQSVVERRNTIPILSNLKLDAGDGKLSLNATDMDLDIIDSVGAEISTPGATTAPAHTLYDIVRKLPEGAQVEMNADGEGWLQLSSGRSRFTLSCLPIDDFPVLSGGELAHEFTLTVAEVKALVDKTKFAISTEETRYYLNGIYVHAAERNGAQVLRAVATDGHRLASVEIPLPDGASGIPGVIVPRKTESELRKLVDETTADIAVGLSAPLVVWTLMHNPNFAASRGFIVWNLLGLLDFAVAGVTSTLASGAVAGLVSGSLTSAPMEVWPLFLFPGFIVPLFMMLHLTALFQVWPSRQAKTLAPAREGST